MRPSSIVFCGLLLACLCMAIAGPAFPAQSLSAPYLWEADTTFGSLGSKAEINSYLDNLKSHGINGVWVQVERYGEGTVTYRKTALSGLPTADRFETGEWANEDVLSYIIGQANSRGMSAMIKFHGSNDVAWDKNPDWRMRDSKGKEVLWSGKLKNFCVNAPYWDKIFFPMVREIGQSYGVDGFYLDTCQVAYSSADTCFCQNCQTRFEKETGQKLPMKSVEKSNWSDPAVKLYAIKRTQWLNEFHEKYRQTIEQAKPGAIALLNVSGGYNSYKDGLSTRHAGKYVDLLTPEPVNTPRMFAVTENDKLRKAGKAPFDEHQLAKQELIPGMNRYGYNEFMVKTMMADGAGKPVIPISRYWFTSDQQMGPTNLEILQIESALGAGAKGHCFFGYLGTAIAKSQVAKTTWADPAYISYLKGIAAGERGKWIADMKPDARVGILYDRNADFWTGDYWKRLRSVGGVFSLLQFQKKNPADLIAASEPDQPGFGPTGYQLDPKTLERYQLVIAPGLDYVCKEDLEKLRAYVENGGHLMIMGGIGAHGKFPGEPITDDAYQILGITTEGEPEPSGFVMKLQKHPVFTAVESTAEFGTFRLSPDKNDAWSYKPRFEPGWESLADEITDSGRRGCVLYRQVGKGAMAYFNSSEVAGYSPQMRQLLVNMTVFTAGSGPWVIPLRFKPSASINQFKSADGTTRYYYIVTPDGESDVELRIRPDKGMMPTTAEIIEWGGKPQPLELIVGEGGGAIVKLAKIKPYSAIIKIKYEQKG